MFSMRALVLLGATIYLLPKDPAQQERFIASAHQAFGWASTYCQRQPETCAKADDIWQDLKAKAHFGVGVVYGLATRKIANIDDADNGYTRAWIISTNVQGNTRRSLDGTSRGTLTNADIVPSWRGQPEK